MMNWKVLTPFLVLGLTLPTSLFANVNVEAAYARTLRDKQSFTSLSAILSDSPSTLPTSTTPSAEMLVAQDYSQLINLLLDGLEQGRVEIRNYALQTARSISPSNMEWRDAVPEIVWNNRQPFLRVTLHGKLKVKILKDKNVRLTLNFQPDNNLRFRYVAPHQLHVSRCRIVCKKKRKKFNRQLTETLAQRRGEMEQAINSRVDRILGRR